MNAIIKECLDMDEWKCSWHNNFSSLNDYESARDVIKDKILDRMRDMNKLLNGLDEIDIIIKHRREDEEEERILEEREAADRP